MERRGWSMAMGKTQSLLLLMLLSASVGKKAFISCSAIVCLRSAEKECVKWLFEHCNECGRDGCEWISTPIALVIYHSWHYSKTVGSHNMFGSVAGSWNDIHCLTPAWDVEKRSAVN